MMGIIFILILMNYVYEDADSLIVDNDSLVICGFHQYNIKVMINNAGKLKVRPWSAAADSFGKLELNAPLITIQSSSSIIGSDAGYSGAYSNSHPQGYGPGGGEAGGVSGGGGGGGAYGGNGGTGGDNYPGAGGIAYGSPSDTIIDIGSGGGAGRLSALDGPGGNGGAEIYLRAQNIIIDSSYIEANGQRGYDGSLEAGGGGAGGGVMVWADTTILHNILIAANGGNGGDASFGGGGGGSGGRIKIFYTSLIDTAQCTYTVQGGAPGTGAYGTPEAGENGTIYIDHIVGIKEVVQQPVQLQILTNPIRKVLKIKTNNPPARVDIFDAAGCFVKTFHLNNYIEYIPLDGLEEGVYFIKGNTCNHYSGKFVVLK